MAEDTTQTIHEKNKIYVVNIRDLDNLKSIQSTVTIGLDKHEQQRDIEPIKSNEERLSSLLREDNIHVTDASYEKIKLEAMILYYSVNSDLVKIGRSLRDAKNVRMDLVQRYERAKESLILHDKILTNQSNDARNYLGIIFTIYDSVVKYTLPSAKLVADLSNLQSEIEMKETKETKLKCVSLIETITDSLQKLSINFPKNITKNSNSKDVAKLFEEMASFIEQNRTKYLNLEKKARDIFYISICQRDQIQKDVIVIIQNISEIDDKIVHLEKDYNKVKDNMDQLLNYMIRKLGIQINGNNVPLLCEDI